MLPSVFEEYKICSSRIKSLLIVDESSINSNDNEDFAMDRRFVV